jgi:hypothetical protein
MASAKKTTWSSADYVGRASRIALERVTASLLAQMREEWGDDWLKQMNQTIQEADANIRRSRADWRNRPEIFAKGDVVDWDLSNLSGTLTDLPAVLPKLKNKAGRIRSAAFKVREIRNAHAHASTTFDVHDAERCQRDIRTLAQLVALVADQEAAAEVEAVADEMITSLQKKADEAPNNALQASELAEIKSLVAELLRLQKKDERVMELATVDVENQEPLKPVSTVMTQSAGIEQEQPLGLPVFPSHLQPKEGQGLVFFPIVSGMGGSGSFAYVKAFPASDAVGTEHLATVLQVRPHQRDSLRHAIEVARDSERDEPDLRRTMFKVEPSDFEGSSFLLAAVLADRAMRVGLSDAFRCRPIIATGDVRRHGHGEVSAIELLEEKITLLKSAPADAIFLYPKVNDGSLSEEARARLKLAVGSGMAVRAVSHLNELDDLFLDHEVEAVRASGENDFNRNKALRTQIPFIAPLRWMRIFGGISVGAAVLLGLAYFAGEIYKSGRIDPVQAQASADRLNSLIRATPNVDPDEISFSQCQAFVASVKGLTELDFDRAGPDHIAALKLADSCESSIQASDQRWQDLEQAAGDEGTDHRSIAKIAEARLALLPFDLNRADRADFAPLLEKADLAVVTIQESDSRIAQLIESLEGQPATGESSDSDPVIGALEEFTAFDVERLENVNPGALASARNSRASVQASDRRIESARRSLTAYRMVASSVTLEYVESVWATLTDYDKSRMPPELLEAYAKRNLVASSRRIDEFDAAAARFVSDGSARNLEAALLALSNLTVEDRALLTDDQLNRIGSIRQEHLQRRNTAATFAALRLAEQQWITAEAGGRGLAVAAQNLIDKLSEIEEVDKAYSSNLDELAINTAERVQSAMAGAKERISMAMRNARLVLAAGSRTSADMARSLGASVNALQQLDRELLSDEERTLLDRACGIQSSPMQDGIAPLRWCLVRDVVDGPTIAPLVVNP